MHLLFLMDGSKTETLRAVLKHSGAAPCFSSEWKSTDNLTAWQRYEKCNVLCALKYASVRMKLCENSLPICYQLHYINFHRFVRIRVQKLSKITKNVHGMNNTFCKQSHSAMCHTWLIQKLHYMSCKTTPVSDDAQLWFISVQNLNFLLTVE